MTSAEFSPIQKGAANDAGSGEKTPHTPFVDMAPKLVRRLVATRWLVEMKHSWMWMSGLLLVLGVAKMWGGGSGWFEWPVMVGLTSSWILGALIKAWIKRPGSYEAFAFWDDRCGRSEAFANAWWIETQKNVSGWGEELHRHKQSQLLQQKMTSGDWKKELPLPPSGWGFVPFSMLLAVCFLPVLNHSRQADRILSAESQQVAEMEGKKLSDRVLDESKMEGLTEHEQQEIKELRHKIGETAKALQQDGEPSAREVLSELERRAREAEQMANRIGARDATWASEKMVSEMRQQADTAELGDAVAMKSAEKTAQQAETLASKLSDETMAEAVKGRLVESFKQIGESAEPEDAKRMVGQHVVAVDQHLTQSLMSEGAKEMRELADKMRVMAQREKTRDQLEKLAQQLRDAGSNIANQGSNGGMQRLDGSQEQNGNQGQGQGGGQSLSSPMMAMPNAPNATQMPSPNGQDQNQQNQQGMQGQSMPMMTPVPGAQQPQDGQSMTMMPNPNNKSPNDGNKDGPMLFAPIPGMPPDAKPDAMILMGGGQSSSRGGLDAGQGTVPIKPEGSQKNTAGQSGMVNAQRQSEGFSSVRTIEGQVRQEAATRTTQQTVLEAIAAEETALEDAALPIPRREQVRRYFQELRQRFEGGS